MAVIRRIHAPLLAPEAIVPYLGAPHHWKDGRSAKSLIDQWWTANALPASVKQVLDQADEWRGSKLIDAFAERCTDLEDGRPSHSQSDMLALLGVRDHLGILVIEAKVDEGFDKTVSHWIRKETPGKAKRLRNLCALLEIDADRVFHLRYQLLHRTASAIIEAKRYRSRQAAMIVQSWSSGSDGFDDFQAFAEAIGVFGVERDRISPSRTYDGVTLRLGWSSEKS